MHRWSLLTLLIHSVYGIQYQSYNGVIDSSICVNPYEIVNTGTNTVTVDTMPPISTIDFTAPIPSNPGNIGIRQIAFAWYDYTYDQPVVTLNGVTMSTYANCCTLTGCDAPLYYTPWYEAECSMTWCGTQNQWQFIDFTGTSMHTIGVAPGSSLSLSFTNPLKILQNNSLPVFALSYDMVLAPSSSPTGTPSQTISTTASITSSVSVTSSPTLSHTPSSSETSSNTHSLSPTASITSSTSLTSSETVSTSLTPSETRSSSRTTSETPSFTRSTSYSISASPSRSLTPSLTISPSGICYSASTIFAMNIVLSGGWIIVNTGINVTQAYGSGYISMGYFQNCRLNGAVCACSYTGGSTVAGCGGGRNSYISYSYGATNSITYVNESPACSYHFTGTIAIPQSISMTPSLTRSIIMSPSQVVSSSSTVSRSSSITLSASPSSSSSSSSSSSPSLSVSPTSSQTTTISSTPSITTTNTITNSRSPSMSHSQFESISISSSGTISASWNSTATSTPLYYITYYASSSPTDRGTVTPSPLYMIIPYPSNGSSSASNTPLFMMIRYPSHSPVVNYTYYSLPDSSGTILAGIGVALLGLTVVGVAVFQFMKPKPPPQVRRQQISNEEKTHIVISTSDFEEVAQLLNVHQKEFSVQSF